MSSNIHHLVRVEQERKSHSAEVNSELEKLKQLINKHNYASSAELRTQIDKLFYKGVNGVPLFVEMYRTILQDFHAEGGYPIEFLTDLLLKFVESFPNSDDNENLAFTFIDKLVDCFILNPKEDYLNSLARTIPQVKWKIYTDVLHRKLVVALLSILSNQMMQPDQTLKFFYQIADLIEKSLDKEKAQELSKFLSEHKKNSPDIVTLLTARGLMSILGYSPDSRDFSAFFSPSGPAAKQPNNNPAEEIDPDIEFEFDNGVYKEKCTPAQNKQVDLLLKKTVTLVSNDAQYPHVTLTLRELEESLSKHLMRRKVLKGDSGSITGGAVRPLFDANLVRGIQREKELPPGDVDLRFEMNAEDPKTFDKAIFALSDVIFEALKKTNQEFRRHANALSKEQRLATKKKIEATYLSGKQIRLNERLPTGALDANRIVRQWFRIGNAPHVSHDSPSTDVDIVFTSKKQSTLGLTDGINLDLKTRRFSFLDGTQFCNKARAQQAKAAVIKREVEIPNALIVRNIFLRTAMLSARGSLIKNFDEVRDAIIHQLRFLDLQDAERMAKLTTSLQDHWQNHYGNGRGMFVDFLNLLDLVNSPGMSSQTAIDYSIILAKAFKKVAPASWHTIADIIIDKANSHDQDDFLQLSQHLLFVVRGLLIIDWADGKKEIEAYAFDFADKNEVRLLLHWGAPYLILQGSPLRVIRDFVESLSKLEKIYEKKQLHAWLKSMQKQFPTVLELVKPEYKTFVAQVLLKGLKDTSKGSLGQVIKDNYQDVQMVKHLYELIQKLAQDDDEVLSDANLQLQLIEVSKDHQQAIALRDEQMQEMLLLVKKQMQGYVVSKIENYSKCLAFLNSDSKAALKNISSEAYKIVFQSLLQLIRQSGQVSTMQECLLALKLINKVQQEGIVPQQELMLATAELLKAYDKMIDANQTWKNHHEFYLNLPKFAQIEPSEEYEQLLTKAVFKSNEMTIRLTTKLLNKNTWDNDTQEALEASLPLMIKASQGHLWKREIHRLITALIYHKTADITFVTKYIISFIKGCPNSTSQIAEAVHQHSLKAYRTDKVLAFELLNLFKEQIEQNLGWQQNLCFDLSQRLLLKYSENSSNEFDVFLDNTLPFLTSPKLESARKQLREITKPIALFPKKAIYLVAEVNGWENARKLFNNHQHLLTPSEKIEISGAISEYDIAQNNANDNLRACLAWVTKSSNKDSVKELSDQDWYTHISTIVRLLNTISDTTASAYVVRQEVNHVIPKLIEAFKERNLAQLDGKIKNELLPLLQSVIYGLMNRYNFLPFAEQLSHMLAHCKLEETNTLHRINLLIAIKYLANFQEIGKPLFNSLLVVWKDPSHDFSAQDSDLAYLLLNDFLDIRNSDAYEKTYELYKALIERLEGDEKHQSEYIAILERLLIEMPTEMLSQRNEKCMRLIGYVFEKGYFSRFNFVSQMAFFKNIYDNGRDSLLTYAWGVVSERGLLPREVRVSMFKSFANTTLHTTFANLADVIERVEKDPEFLKILLSAMSEVKTEEVYAITKDIITKMVSILPNDDKEQCLLAHANYLSKLCKKFGYHGKKHQYFINEFKAFHAFVLPHFKKLASEISERIVVLTTVKDNEQPTKQTLIALWEIHKAKPEQERTPQEQLRLMEVYLSLCPLDPSPHFVDEMKKNWKVSTLKGVVKNDELLKQFLTVVSNAAHEECPVECLNEIVELLEGMIVHKNIQEIKFDVPTEKLLADMLPKIVTLCVDHQQMNLLKRVFFSLAQRALSKSGYKAFEEIFRQRMIKFDKEFAKDMSQMNVKDKNRSHQYQRLKTVYYNDNLPLLKKLRSFIAILPLYALLDPHKARDYTMQLTKLNCGNYIWRLSDVIDRIGLYGFSIDKNNVVALQAGMTPYDQFQLLVKRFYLEVYMIEGLAYKRRENSSKILLWRINTLDQLVDLMLTFKGHKELFSGCLVSDFGVITTMIFMHYFLSRIIDKVFNTKVDSDNWLKIFSKKVFVICDKFSQLPGENTIFGPVNKRLIQDLPKVFQKALENMRMIFSIKAGKNPDKVDLEKILSEINPSEEWEEYFIGRMLSHDFDEQDPSEKFVLPISQKTTEFQFHTVSNTVTGLFIKFKMNSTLDKRIFPFVDSAKGKEFLKVLRKECEEAFAKNLK